MGLSPTPVGLPSSPLLSLLFLPSTRVRNHLDLGKPKPWQSPTKRRLPDEPVRPRKRLRTNLLRQSCPEPIRFRHAPLWAPVSTSGAVCIRRDPVEVNVVPEGISFVSNRTPLHRTCPKACSREAGKDLCVTRRFHTRRPTHETRPLATASPRASNSCPTKCASTPGKARLVDTGRKSRELLTSLDRSPSPPSSRAPLFGLQYAPSEE